MSDNIKIVKRILGIKDNNFDEFFIFCEKSIVDKIIIRCNIKNIPIELDTLIQEFLIEQYTINRNGIGEGKKEVSSASDNGQSINFNVIGGASDMSKNATDFVNSKMEILIYYRKMRR